MNIVDFITARLNEDEQIAQAAIDHKRPGTHWQWVYIANDGVVAPGGIEDPYQEQSVSLRTVEQFPTTSGVGDLPAFAIKYAEEVHPGAGEHIARHDPARVLRQCASLRQIVEAIQELVEDGEAPRLVDATTVWRLAPVAAIWSDHPDYREGWAG